MKLETVASLAVTTALAVGALPLISLIQHLRTSISVEQRLTDRTQQELIPRSTAGIDVRGQLRYETLPLNAKRLVLFAIRHATLDEDLRVWKGVAETLATQPGVYLVGYCDSIACSKALTSLQQAIPFVVIAYGEPITVQATLNADAKGQSLVVDGSMRPLRSLSWRVGNRTASDIAREVLK